MCIFHKYKFLEAKHITTEEPYGTYWVLQGFKTVHHTKVIFICSKCGKPKEYILKGHVNLESLKNIIK